MLLRVSLFLGLSIFIAGCGVNEQPNECQLIVSNLEGHHALTHNGLTYSSRIDRLIGNRKFNRLKPNHNNDFPSCIDARKQADNDFLRLRPQIIQVNGITGDMPYQNDVYEQLLGLHIKNTGCSSIPYYKCYNNRTWELLNHFYQTNIQNELEVFVTQRSCLAINSELEVLVEATLMPKILAFDTITQSNNQPILCSCSAMIYGTFKVEVNKKGLATVLGYQDGFFDTECQLSISRYLENIPWQPAYREGQAFTSIVSVQVANF